MDINNISKQIFNEKPKPKFTVQMNLDINSDINEQFEVISLIFLNGINHIIYQKNVLVDDVKESKKIISKHLFLLKLYFNSFGIDFKIDNITKKECSHKLFNYPFFYSKNKYPFTFVFLKNKILKGRKFQTQYNFKKKSNSINEIFIIFKIQNHYFSVSFNFLKK